MTDIHLVHSLTKLIKEAIDTIPSDVTGLTVAAVSGNQIQLSTNPGGAADAWSYGILEVTTGVAEGLRSVIVSNNGSIITLGATFGNDYPISVGDTVSLKGGPLKSSRVYMFEPISIKKALSDNYKFFVTVNSLDGKVSFKGMGGRSTKGMSAAIREYGMEVIVETPNITGDFADEDDVRRVLFDLPTLKDQICVLCHYFKMHEGSRVYGIGDIEFTYAMIQRTGSDVERKACILEFDITSI